MLLVGRSLAFSTKNGINSIAVGFSNVKMVLAESDRKLLNDMTSQRDAEIHEEGAEVLPEV